MLQRRFHPRFSTFQKLFSCIPFPQTLSSSTAVLRESFLSASRTKERKKKRSQPFTIPSWSRRFLFDCYIFFMAAVFLRFSRFLIITFTKAFSSNDVLQLPSKFLSQFEFWARFVTWCVVLCFAGQYIHTCNQSISTSHPFFVTELAHTWTKPSHGWFRG